MNPARASVIDRLSFNTLWKLSIFIITVRGISGIKPEALIALIIPSPRLWMFILGFICCIIDLLLVCEMGEGYNDFKGGGQLFQTYFL